MSVTVALRHRTDYRYAVPAVLSPQIVRLHPAPHMKTPIRHYAIVSEPLSNGLAWHDDEYDNRVATIVVGEPTDHFAVEVNLETELVAVNPYEFVLDDGATNVPISYDPITAAELAPYLAVEGLWSAELADWLATSSAVAAEGRPTVEALAALAETVARTIGYEVRLEPGVQSSEVTIGRVAGSCRDSSWLLVDTLRRLGFAARFVSGYLIQLAAPGPTPVSGLGPMAAPVTADTTDLHAWTEVFLPGAGWVGFDPTSGLAVGEGHVPLAAAPTPAGAAPISGTASSGATGFAYVNEITRVAGRPGSG